MANFIPKIVYTPILGGSDVTITFTYPPEKDPFSETQALIVKTTRSSNGTKQTQYNYKMEQFEMKFKLVSKTIMDLVRTFIVDHAARGGSFKYYIHSDVASYNTYDYVKNSFSINRTITDRAGDFFYDFKFQMERVV